MKNTARKGKKGMCRKIALKIGRNAPSSSPFLNGTHCRFLLCVKLPIFPPSKLHFKLLSIYCPWCRDYQGRLVLYFRLLRARRYQMKSLRRQRFPASDACQWSHCSSWQHQQHLPPFHTCRYVYSTRRSSGAGITEDIIKVVKVRERIR